MGCGVIYACIMSWLVHKSGACQGQKHYHLCMYYGIMSRLIHRFGACQGRKHYHSCMRFVSALLQVWCLPRLEGAALVLGLGM